MFVAPGATDVTTYFVLRDSETREPKTDVSVTAIDLYYLVDRAAISAKSDAAALASAAAAHADNSAYHVGLGHYRIDWPDAAFAGAAGTKVQLIVFCTGVDQVTLEVELHNEPLTAAQIRADLDANSAKLANLDATVGSRSTLAAGAAMTLTGAYDAAKTAASASAVAALGAPLQASGYAAPDNASAAAAAATAAKVETLLETAGEDFRFTAAALVNAPAAAGEGGGLTETQAAELHLCKAALANTRTHVIATGVDEILDDDGETVLRVMTPSEEDGVIAITPS